MVKNRRHCESCAKKGRTKCSRCDLAITEGGLKTSLGAYHNDCFTCVECDDSLIGNPPYSIKGKNGGEMICANCYTVYKCHTCQRNIMLTKLLVYRDKDEKKYYHSDCYSSCI